MVRNEREIAHNGAHDGNSPRAPIGATAERLLRMLVLTRQPASHYALDLFRTLATEAAPTLKVGLKAKVARIATKRKI